MSLLTLVRAACDRIGLARPSTVISATDQTTRTLMAFATEEGENLAAVHPWQQLRKEGSFTTVAAALQTSSIPDDWLRFVNETWWNRSTKRPLYGPLTPQAWQEVNAWTSSPVVDSFMVRAGSIYISPTPTAGQSVYYEYVSKKWVVSSASYYETFQADADTTLVPEKLITLGVVWRFKQSKGLAWEGDYGKYETQLKQAMMDDQPSAIFNMSGYRERRPGVVVPEGSWTP